MSLTSALMAQRRSAYDKNLRNILACTEPNREACVCDLGCDDGAWTVKVGTAIGTTQLSGVEIAEDRQSQAQAVGVCAVQADLNERLPYDNGSFDVVHANQVIEHLCDTDRFVSEIYRICKPRGYAVISTENLASWHNIVALCLGYMPFSLTNTTMKTADLGNPLAPHYGEEFYASTSWQHKTVFTAKGLVHLFQLHGFSVEAIKGAGYYPLGNSFSEIDPFHSAFITIKARKA